MGYAVRNDGLGWRAVSGIADVTSEEYYSETEPSPSTEVILAYQVRAERDRRINRVIWRIERHEREIRLGLTLTDSAEIITALDTYIQALCALPGDWANFPGTGPTDPACPWPTEPAFSMPA